MCTELCPMKGLVGRWAGEGELLNVLEERGDRKMKITQPPTQGVYHPVEQFFGNNTKAKWNARPKGTGVRVQAEAKIISPSSEIAFYLYSFVVLWFLWVKYPQLVQRAFWATLFPSLKKSQELAFDCRRGERETEEIRDHPIQRTSANKGSSSHTYHEAVANNNQAWDEPQPLFFKEFIIYTPKDMHQNFQQCHCQWRCPQSILSWKSR